MANSKGQVEFAHFRTSLGPALICVNADRLAASPLCRPTSRVDPMPAQSYVRWFSDISLSDVPEVGGKTASLGELYAMLAREGVRVPEGFALTARAYRDALAAAGVEDELRRLLSNFDHHDVALLAERAATARRLVYEATGTALLRHQIAAAYHALEEECGTGVAVAVRSSATAEDLPT